MFFFVVGERFALWSDYEWVRNCRRFHSNPWCKFTETDIENVEHRRIKIIAYARSFDVRSSTSWWNSYRYFYLPILYLHLKIEDEIRLFDTFQGLDRLVCLLCNAKSIRNVIAFPKTLEGRDPMSGAPDTISDELKTLYHIQTIDKWRVINFFSMASIAKWKNRTDWLHSRVYII